MKNKEWINQEEYPFAAKQVSVGGYRMNYADVGAGETILFVHGTPGWSFEYRKVIKELSQSYRCVAPDHLGFGLSEKPAGIDYKPSGHARRLKELIEKLQLNKFHLVVHDFGGPIGLSVAMDHPEAVSSVTVLNSWLWRLDGYEHFTKPARLIETPLGKFLYEKLNFSANYLLKSGFYDQKNLTKEIHRHYKIAQDKAGRKAAYEFALSLLGESEWYEHLWQKREALQGVALQVIWGMRDKLLPAEILLEKWRSGFPRAVVHEINDAGHFPHEESAGFVAGAILALAT